MCCIVSDRNLPKLEYIDSIGDETEVHYYLAIDVGASSRYFDLELVHDFVWVSLEDVDSTLTHSNLKKFWNDIKFDVMEVFCEKNT